MMKNVLYGIDVRKLDLDSWPTVDQEEIKDDDDRALYCRRREAMLVLINSGGNTKAAAKVGQCSTHEVCRILHRCIGTHMDGRIVGFRGCIPRHRIKEYERGVATVSGTAGLFSKLLREHPEVAKPLLNYALGRGPECVSAPTPTDLRFKLLDLCRKAGFTPSQYPLSADEGAIKPLTKWQDSLADLHGRAYNDTYFGEDSANNFDDGTVAYEAAMDPHRTMVLDEYTINTFAAIGVLGRDGLTNWAPMSRFTSISGRWRGSGIPSVCLRFLRKQPDTTQFLLAVESAIRPHKRRTFDVSGLSYPAGPCLISEIPGAGWMVPDLVLLDSAKVHLAKETRRALTQSLGCIVMFGIIRRPKSRSDVEAWHNYLSENFCKSPSTAGTGPDDPHRRDPEAIAVKLRITEDHVAQALEVLMARFAVNPLKSLKGKTPLEAAQHWFGNDDTIVRRLPLAMQESFCLCDIRVPVTISCDLKSGHQPVVRFKHAVYVGPQLAHMRTANRQECRLVLNPQRAHIGRLCEVDGEGSEIDVLRTTGEWRDPHRLSDREDYRKLRKARKIPAASKEKSPLMILAEHLAAGAPSSSAVALALADFIDAHRQEIHGQKPNVTEEAALVAEPEEERSHNKLVGAGNW